jgi:hypothetical protein
MAFLISTSITLSGGLFLWFRNFPSNSNVHSGHEIRKKGALAGLGIALIFGSPFVGLIAQIIFDQG